MTTAELVLLSTATSVGLVALAFLTCWIALMAWQKVCAFWSLLLDSAASETK